MKQKDKKPDIKFVSYDGSFPNLCRGTLVVDIEGTAHSFGDEGEYPAFWTSGGSAYCDHNWEEHVAQGEWKLSAGDDYPAAMRPWLDELLKVFNENVPQGCCGGCI